MSCVSNTFFFNFNQLKSVEKNVPKNILLTFFIGTYLGEGHKIGNNKKKTKQNIVELFDLVP